MAYDGELLDQCGLIPTDFKGAAVVGVSGDTPNLCGHLLFYAGPARGGYYYHVPGLPNPRSAPKYLTESGYRRYLDEAGKSELRRIPVELRNAQGVFSYLEQSLSEPWTWAVLPNNCVAFVEDVIRAGGGTWSSASNCPTVAIKDSLSQRVEAYLRGLDAEIRRLYGVPQ